MSQQYRYPLRSVTVKRKALEEAEREDAERGDAERGDAERGDAERGDAERAVLRGDAERGDAERGDAEIAVLRRDAVIPSSIFNISNSLNKILKIAFESASTQIASDIQYRIGKYSISSNFQFLAKLFNIHLIAPIKYILSEDMKKITVYIIFNNRALINSPSNCLTIILKKHTPTDEISSICPNVWELGNTPIVNEMVGNVFNLALSDDKKDTFILTNISFGLFDIEENIITFLKKLLKANMETLSPSKLNNIYTIKFKFGNILLNLNFIFHWFNIQTIINSHTHTTEDTIQFRMILRMRDARTNLSMMHIYLKKYTGEIKNIETNIALRATTLLQQCEITNYTYIYKFMEQNRHLYDGLEIAPNSDANTWIIDKIDFII